jgi:ADP-ribosylglycohydrolase
MSMPGGGTFNLRPGQVTDDSEMAFHLLKALSTYDLDQSLNKQMNNLLVGICHGYTDWKKSKPFDIGNTCRNGIKQIEKKLKDIDS